MKSLSQRLWLGIILCIVSVPLQFVALDARLSRQAIAAGSIVMAVCGIVLVLTAWFASRHD